MVKKKNVITICLLFTFLHGQKTMPSSTVKHESLIFSLPLAQKKLPAFQGFNPYTTRDVVFQNDLLRELTTTPDEMDRLRSVNIVIKAVNEYHCPQDEEVRVTIQDNKWVIVIKNITEGVLLECLPIDGLVPEKRCRNLLEKYLSAATQWLSKVGIYVWGKTLANYVRCTIMIHGNIHPENKHIRCSDIIDDITLLAETNKLNIKRQTQDLLNTHIIISEK